MKKTPNLLLLFLLFTSAASAQINKFYTDYTPTGISKRQIDLNKDFKKFRLVKQNISAVQSFRQSLVSTGTVSGLIAIPLVDKGDIEFRISPVETLSKETSANFPQMKSYAGVSADGTMRLRLTMSHLGMMGSVRVKGEKAVHYFTILDNEQPDILVSFLSSDVVSALPVTCGTNDINSLKEEFSSIVPSKRASGDCMLRTYRFAVAATGEYTLWAGGQSNAIAHITTTVNNVNEIYENDFTIHLSLIAQLSNIYPDTATDPYTTGKVLNSELLRQTDSLLNANTGSANYDVGMAFGYGWSGGLANLYAVCSSNKGRGAGGLNSGFPLGSSGPIFDGIIAHELGHQFSAMHTMAANNGGCDGNVVGASGWEPGGGSTIMAYAGTCSGNEYQVFSDNYFHGGTVAQITHFITVGSGRTCGTQSPSGNNAPVVTVPSASYSIPYGTPFVLNANATDADATDVLTYNWEQMNAIGGMGTSSPPSATASGGPLFRSFIPSTSSTRYFPSKEVLLGNASGTYEVLPRVARTLNFKVTVRDNHVGAGCVAYEDVAVNVQNCGAFEITNLTAPASFVANGTNTITLNWNAATACVSMPAIDILFSTDGGITYPYTILSGTANDGTETFIVPNLATCAGRFMIKSIGNIYYNINTADITISSSCSAKGAAITPATDFAAPGAGDPSLNLSEAPLYGTPITLPFTGSITSTDNAGNLSFYDENTASCSGPSNPINYDTLSFYPSVSGTYTFQKSAATPSGLLLNLYSDNYLPGNVCSNFLSSSATILAGDDGVTLSNNVTADLCAGKRYVLVVSSFSSSSSIPALPAAYSIALVSSPAGGGLYTGLADPGLNYSYLIVDNGTNTIVEIKSAADLRDNTKYLSNGVYNVYGISSSASASTLSSQYAGQSFSNLSTDALEQVGGLCAQLSTNSRRVAIGNAALPVDILRFNAKLVNENQALLNWAVSFEYDVKAYVVERSLNGTSYTDLGTVSPLNLNNGAEQLYSFIDNDLSVNAGKYFYRLRIHNKDGKIDYSPIAVLQLNKKWSASIYPNPVQHSVLALFIDAITADRTTIQVIDMSGRIVLTKQMGVNKGVNKISIPVGQLANGMYMLQIKGQAENAVLNFIKK